MNRKHLTGLIAMAATATAIGFTGISTHDTKVQNQVLLVNSNTKSNDNNNSTSPLELAASHQYKMRVTTAFIGIPPTQNGFAADPNFNPNGFASPLNQKLYNYESSPANQTAAMDEAISLHGGNPENTCVFFQSSCLRAIGVNVPDKIGYTTYLEDYLQNNGWQKQTDFNFLQKGDICFAGDTHTFLFMGWKNKAKGIAYVMGDEAYMFGSSYHNRNLNGQTANENNGWNNQYEATCFYKYTGSYTGGQVQNAPTSKWIGRVAITSPVGLWMNKGPSANTSQIACIGNNLVLNVIKEENGWYEVYYDGNYGWIDGQYTTGLGNPTESKSANVENANIPSNAGSAIGTTVTTALEGLDLGTSPSFNSNTIVSIPNATKLYVFDQSNNGWEKVYYNGHYGWIYAEYTTGLTKTNNNPTPKSPSKTSKPTSNNSGHEITIESPVGLWMTKGPSPSSGNIVCLPYNTKVTATAKQNGWYKINYNGQSGWVDGAYTSSANFNNTNNNTKNTPKKNSNKVIGQVTIQSPVGLWMTKGPRAYSGNITCLNYNTKVNVIGENNGWYEINYDGQTGWVDGAYTSNLTNSNNTTSNSPNTPKSTNKTPKTTSNNAGQEITIESPVGLWMTKGPRAYSGNITCLPYNTKVTVIGENNGWYEINYNGQTGWVDGAYTSSLTKPNNSTSNSPNAPKSTKKTSTATSGQEITIESPVGLWMTEGPRAYSGNITCLPYNTKVIATAKQNGWYKINYNGQSGWVDGAYTSSASFNNTGSVKSSNSPKKVNTTKKTSPNSNSKKFIGQVTIDSPVGLWMTKGPKAYSGNITCLNYNTTVNVTGESNGWYEIEYNGQTGWIDSAYTSSLYTNDNNSSTNSTLPNSVSVTSPIGLYMSHGPNGEGGNITCLPSGYTLKVLSEQNGWYKVSTTNGQIGWVDAAYTTA